MVTIKVGGTHDVKLSEREFDLMVESLYKHIMWESGGMFGDGDNITDGLGMALAKRIIKKLGYQI